jgi:hypothetical protein
VSGTAAGPELADDMAATHFARRQLHLIAAAAGVVVAALVLVAATALARSYEVMVVGVTIALVAVGGLLVVCVGHAWRVAGFALRREVS